MIRNLNHILPPDNHRTFHSGAAEKIDSQRNDFIIVGSDPVKHFPPRVPAEYLHSGKLLRQADPPEIIAENDPFEFRQHLRFLPQSALIDIAVLNAVPAQALRYDRHDAVLNGILFSVIVDQQHYRAKMSIFLCFLRFCPARIGARRESLFRGGPADSLPDFRRQQRRVPQCQRHRCRGDIQLPGKIIQVSRFSAKRHNRSYFLLWKTIFPCLFKLYYKTDFLSICF